MEVCITLQVCLLVTDLLLVLDSPVPPFCLQDLCVVWPGPKQTWPHLALSLLQLWQMYFVMHCTGTWHRVCCTWNRGPLSTGACRLIGQGFG